jgi:hypothetical protein
MAGGTVPALVVALIGRNGDGQDTLAAQLVTRGYAHHKLATPLEAGVAAMFGFSDDQVRGDAVDVLDERWGVTPRSLIEWMGTEVMQHSLQAHLTATRKGVSGDSMSPGFWAEQRLVEAIRSRAVVSDVRFGHEVAALRRAFPNVLAVRIQRLSKPEHVSESEVDATIVNDGDDAKLLIRFDEVVGIYGLEDPRLRDLLKMMPADHARQWLYLVDEADQKGRQP